MHPTRNPQLSSARALVELLTAHPELPVIRWDINGADGILRGDVFGPDTRGIVRAYAEALGSTVLPPSVYEWEGRPRVSEHLFACWRDVEIAISSHSDATAFPALAVQQVAA